MIDQRELMLRLWQRGPNAAAALGEGAVLPLLQLSLEKSNLGSDAVRAIELMGKTALPELLHLAEYGKPELRTKAMAVLGTVGSRMPLPETVEPLLSIVEDKRGMESMKTRRDAAKALSKIQEKISGENLDTSGCLRPSGFISKGNGKSTRAKKDREIRKPLNGPRKALLVTGRTP